MATEDTPGSERADIDGSNWWLVVLVPLVAVVVGAAVATLHQGEGLAGALVAGGAGAAVCVSPLMFGYLLVVGLMLRAGKRSLALILAPWPLAAAIVWMVLQLRLVSEVAAVAADQRTTELIMAMGLSETVTMALITLPPTVCLVGVTFWLAARRLRE
jgi:hypothetical protein